MKNKFLILLLFASLAGVLGLFSGLAMMQAVIVSIFTFSIIGSLVFWDYRLGFVFIGSGIFLLIGAVSLEEFIKFASLDVILFLVSMMVIVAMMKGEGVFDWIITVILRWHNLNGKNLFFILMGMSAFFSAVMGEVASIMVMVTVILTICNFLEIKSTPLVISSILATNIGSAATVLGNPVGVLIAARGKLPFESFLVHALPLSVIILTVTALILFVVYRKYIDEMTKKLIPYAEDEGFLRLISVPLDKKEKLSLIIFVITILFIALHRRFELLLQLPENTLLIAFPVLAAGAIMLYRYDKARHYIEREVEWNSLLFFMFLFAQAGVIRASGVAEFIATRLVEVVGNQETLMCGIVLFTNGILSSLLDNVIAVASFIPIVESLHLMYPNLEPLWWALLFGACFGGNITMIGSTANIIALGILEKEENVKIHFLEWLKIGLPIGIMSMLISYLAIIIFHIL